MYSFLQGGVLIIFVHMIHKVVDREVKNVVNKKKTT